MPVIILKGKNWVEKVCRLHENSAQNFRLSEFWQPYTNTQQLRNSYF